MSENRLSAGSPAPEIEVLNVDGERVDLAQVWSGGPVLLTFLRHFG